MAFKKRRIFVLALIVLIFISTQGVYASGEIDLEKATPEINKLGRKVDNVTLILTGFAVLTGVGAIIVHFVRLGMAQNCAYRRRKIIKDLLVVGLCLTLLGSLAFFSRLFLGIWV